MIIGWIMAGIIAYGLILGVFSNEFPHMKHLGIAIIAGLGGPVGVIAALLFCLIIQRWGFQLKPFSYELRLQFFMNKFGALGKEFFDEHDA